MSRWLYPYMKNIVISLTWKRIRHMWTKFHIDISSIEKFGYDSLIQFFSRSISIQKIVGSSSTSIFFVFVSCFFERKYDNNLFFDIFFIVDRSIFKILMKRKKCRNFKFQREQIRRRRIPKRWYRRNKWNKNYSTICFLNIEFYVSTSFFFIDLLGTSALCHPFLCIYQEMFNTWIHEKILTIHLYVMSNGKI